MKTKKQIKQLYNEVLQFAKFRHKEYMKSEPNSKESEILLRLSNQATSKLALMCEILEIEYKEAIDEVFKDD